MKTPYTNALPLDSLQQIAHNNLQDMCYPLCRYGGRYLFAGILRNGLLFQALAVTVRTPKYQNRRLEDRGGGLVSIAIADENQELTEETVLYDAMMEVPNHHIYICGNGNHIRAVMDGRRGGKTLHSIMTRQRPEDDPQRTPRIVTTWEPGRMYGPQLQFAIVRPSYFIPNENASEDEASEVSVFHRYATPGYGFGFRTYQGSILNPIVAYDGVPALIRLWGDNINEATLNLWRAMNPDIRVSIAAKTIDPKTGESVVFTENRFPKVLKKALVERTTS